ncbi:sodium- and chloride-dependent taurine transporter-like [Pomacea canaliculata]|uniref:sodium- and chloride-dependent taurine transporter-like n=1 Tax=Pomacea canaliculata TaxID=400727 RepID=UPI000D72D8A7|nr:sodium- and chloride-dependent taurine transporter-like [Pomacea canaliculata]XP_025088322.1 sodium- and chloride-dependent taurine transporter-like [Pomacea canaliculata]XP_025088323.1 sodium- and chloride-dependent taurine transporter-like [Pomacea canaliculata]
MSPKKFSPSVDLELAVKPNNSEEPEVRVTKREQWSRAFDFLLACIGFSVGLGNVWRFPYLCYKNGGGAFLIPYVLCVVFGSLPLFYLEVAVGQFMNRGGLQCWNLVPILQGIGLASCIIVFFLNCYYNVILSWAFYYFFASFTSELPWVKCGNYWNSPDLCALPEDYESKVNESGDPNITSRLIDPVTEYWENKVLSISGGIDQVGTVKWDLALCLLLAWIVVYACICKGIRSSGKVMYVTATSPYVFMLILLVRNSMLDGASDGVKFYLTPNITKLGEMQVWVDAGTQVFFSSSIALGTLAALGSYNKFNHNSYRDSVAFTCVNSGTSFLAGFIVFTILGYMAKLQNRPVSEVAESGPGLAFIAYPKAVAQMPIAPLWSVFFFLMMILLGLDSQFVGVEGVITTVVDQYPNLLRKGHRKEIFTAFACIVMFLIGLSMVTKGGMYVFQLFDYYSGSRIILLVAFFELVGVSYIYGIRRFYDNVRMMLGDVWIAKTLPYMVVCWTVLSPVFCLAVFVMSAINYSELDYKRPRSTYTYPGWAVGIGWTLAASSAVWIPLVGFYKWIKHGMSMEALRLLCKPYGLKEHQLREKDLGEITLAKLERKRNGADTGSNVAHSTQNGQVNLAFDASSPCPAENQRL